MSVAGLDFGNLSLLIALTRAGGVDVILNSASNRQTATAVSVQGRQRFIGDEGAAMVRGCTLLWRLLGCALCISILLLEADPTSLSPPHEPPFRPAPTS
jgi:hypothetical protein